VRIVRSHHREPKEYSEVKARAGAAVMPVVSMMMPVMPMMMPVMPMTMPVMPMTMPVVSMMPVMMPTGAMVLPVPSQGWHRHTQKEYSRANEQHCVYTSLQHGMLSFVKAGLMTPLNIHQGSSLPGYGR
jgi:hypothetical protein